MFTILLADDDAFVRTMVTDILTSAEKGYRIVQAKDGAEAVTAVEREKPDLVLLDLIMPGKSGLETLRILRATAPAVRVVVVSSIDLPSMVTEALENGAIAFLSKPFDAEQVLRVVSDVLSRKV